jgi:hypothetical protein
VSSVAPVELAEGLWSWSCRHPEWHPGEFGAEVVSFAAWAPGRTLQLIDPLLPDDDPDAVLERLDAEAGRAEAVAILITIGYHVRSTEQLWGRWERSKRVTIHGNRTCVNRLDRARRAFEPIVPGKELPGGAVGHQIGKPRRTELPLHLPAADAVVFGDAVVGLGGELRVWATRPVDTGVERFHRERFNPTREPRIELGAERMLMTHGESVLTGGSAALRHACEARPWYHRL